MTTSVLVVDDDDDVRSLIVLQLSLDGLVVTESATVDGAMDALESSKPDLVLTDLNFGTDSGERLVRYCIETDQPVILMTASVSARDLPREFLERVPILRKPFSLTELSAAVQAVGRP